MRTQAAAVKRYIALLRAINVGGHNVKMADLRKLFETLGFSNVDTFIASGNVIFESPTESIEELEERIENQLQASLGYAVTTFIRSSPALTEIAADQPFPAEELATAGATLYIAFLKEHPSEEAQQKLMGFRTPEDDFHIHGCEVYWLCRTKFSDSKFSGPLLEKTLGMQATVRNSTTVRKLAAKYATE